MTYNNHTRCLNNYIIIYAKYKTKEMNIFVFISLCVCQGRDSISDSWYNSPYLFKKSTVCVQQEEDQIDHNKICGEVLKGLAKLNQNQEIRSVKCRSDLQASVI